MSDMLEQAVIKLQKDIDVDKNFKFILENPYVVNVIRGAVNSIMAKNKNMSFTYFQRRAKFHTWNQLKHKYIPSTQDDLKDNLVVRFLSTRIYLLLMNDIRDFHKMKSGEDGLVQRFEKISLSKKISESMELSETLFYADDNTDNEYVDLSETVRKLLSSGQIDFLKYYVFLLKSIEKIEIKEISKIVKKTLDIDILVPYISLFDKQIKEQLSYYLEEPK